MGRTGKGFEWPEGWSPISSGDQEASFERELALEIGSNHPLHGLRWTIVARRDGSDDVLLQLERKELPFAEVHMTWSGAQTGGAKWPRTAFFDSLLAWAIAAAP